MSTDADARIDQVLAHAREHVGVARRIPLGRLQERDMARFALVTGHTGAEYRDADAAGEAGLPGVAAAPLFLTAVLGWGAGPEESDLLTDGNAAGPLGDVPLGGLRLMGGGQDLTFHEPVVAGMDVVMETEVCDVVRKDGRGGPLLVLDVRRRYLDGRGRLLVEVRESFLAR